jgi:hypothetical protein
MEEHRQRSPSSMSSSVSCKGRWLRLRDVASVVGCFIAKTEVQRASTNTLHLTLAFEDCCPLVRVGDAIVWTRGR